MSEITNLPDHVAIILDGNRRWARGKELQDEDGHRKGIETLVLTHYVPAFPSGQGDEWKQIASQHFSGRIELGDDLHRVEIGE